MKGQPYDVRVYYHGPRSAFSLRVDDAEVIFEGSTRWLWCARRIARLHLGNTNRCGYLIMQGDKRIEEVVASNSAYKSI